MYLKPNLTQGHIHNDHIYRCYPTWGIWSNFFTVDLVDNWWDHSFPQLCGLIATIKISRIMQGQCPWFSNQLEFKQQIHINSLICEVEWYLVKLYVFEPLSGWTPAVRKDWRKFGASPTQDVRLILYYNPLLLPSWCCTGYLQFCQIASCPVSTT